MKKAIFLFTVLIVGFVFFTGQKFQDDSPRWNLRPEMMRIGPQGNFVPLPQPVTENYVNPNTQTNYIYSPNGVFAVGPNFRPYPTAAPGTQSECAVYVSLLNPNWIFASANDITGGVFRCGAYCSTNGGVNWYGMAAIPNTFCDPGPIIDKDGNFILSEIAPAYNMGVAYSTNKGLNWSTLTVPGSTTSSDKNLSGTNYCATSPYYGHSYTVYTEFGGTYANRIVFTRTTNGGSVWSTVAPVSPPTASGHHHQGCDVTAGPEGNVYAIWANCTTNGQNSTEDSLGFAKSTDGGVTWAIQTNHAADMNGIRAASFGPWAVRVAGFPRIDVDKSGGPRNGWLYVVASEKSPFPGADAADIFLWRSSNQGTNWSAPIRVNQDPANGRLQYHAAVNVDAGGGLNVIYHDCRNSNNNDSVDTYVNRSVDGGNTWTEIKVNDHKFRPSYISGTAGGYQGDYIGISSGNNKIWPFWAENRTGYYQIWTAVVDIGPSITHTPLTNTEQTTGTRVVNCSILPAGSGINPSTVQLKYAKNSTSWTTVAMTNSGGTNWTANLTLSGAGTYNYYLTATDSMARTATSPAGAPASYHSFIASSDTVKPVITHTPIGNTPKSVWPISVTATVTDNIGVDSVWVKWYKRPPNTFTTRQFKLLLTSGNSYSALFNSTNPEVDYNDTIYYRIFAQDNSSGHNRDSSALYSFKIINLVNVCLGTGTTSSNYPFTTFWMDGRTQMLFTATELNAGGAGPNSAITKLGFNVITVGGPAMSGFNVRFQHTTATSLTGFITTGWTTAFTGTYTVAGTGWQYIDMTSPYFAYNGTSNLLVEICYDNSAYTSYSPVNSTANTGKTWGYYTDNVAGCTMTGGSAQANRPNTCFTMTTINSTNNISNIIPKQYSLNQNYPNPFNPVTRINFEIPKQGLVSLRVYDVLGREVKSLVNEVKAPGVYSIDFNGTELSSGVYFYKLESNSFSDIKKMMLIK